MMRNRVSLGVTFGKLPRMDGKLFTGAVHVNALHKPGGIQSGYPLLWGGAGAKGGVSDWNVGLRCFTETMGEENGGR